jgi:peptidyl-prolyl cis-trans isomerase D
MFNLFRSRAKVKQYMMGGLLLLVALSMVTYLIPGGYSSSGGSQDQVIAQIGKETLTVRDVQQQMQAAMRNKKFPAEMAGYYVGQLIDELINTRSLVYEAKRMGIEVTDADLAGALRANFPMLFPNGQFVGKDAYAAILEQQQGMTIPDFETELRQQLLLSRLNGLVDDSVIVTPDEVAREFRNKNEKVKLEYVALSSDKLRSEVNITPDQVRAYFERARSQYQTPEKRSFDMLVADETKLGQKITIPDDELRRIYEANKDQYRVPERVHVRHILLKTTDKPKDDLPKIQARAEDLLKQLNAGADFSELAKKNSEDPGSAAKGGDLGWITRGQTVPAFESAAFSLKPQELSGVIKTEYGFHILQVLGKEDAHIKPFEEVKDQIAQERKRQQVIDDMQKLADQAHDELVKQPQQAAEIASRLGLDLVRVEHAEPEKPVPEIGTSPDFSAAISGLPRGGVTPVLQVSGNKLVVAVVTDVVPVHPSALAEVEGQVRTALTNQRASDLAMSRAKELLERVKAAHGDLKKVAQEMGLEVKTTQEFTRDGAADGIGPASLLQAAFEQPVGSVFGPVALDTQRFVCEIESKIPADMTKLDAASRSALRSEIKSEKGRERMGLFTDSVRNALIREGKLKIHQRVMDQVVGNYRS